MGEPAIKAEPDWIAAGEDLVRGLQSLPEGEPRLSLMQRLCADLGDALYPAFLKMLCAIGRFGDAPARALAAETLAEALASGRLPSGRIAAWGASFGPSPGRAGRSLGPIEYLAVWHLEARRSDPVDETSFLTASRLLIALIIASPAAASAYAAKLRQEVEDPIEGTYSRATRRLLDVFADCLDSQAAPEDAARRIQVAVRSIRAEASRTRWTGA
jgi:hypothetical protein